MKNNLTYAVLDQLALARAGASIDAIDPILRRETINALVFSLWEKRKDDPFYRFTSTLAIASDTESLCRTGGTIPGSPIAMAGSPIITGFTATTITRSSGSFPVGALLALTLLRRSGASYGTVTGFAKVITGGPTATFQLLSGFMDTYNPADDGLMVAVLRSQSAISSDFSPVYFDRIVRVYDNKTRPTQGDFDAVLSGEDFAGLKFLRTMGSRVAYYHRGTSIDFFLGASAPSLGVVSVEYAGKPGLYTTTTADNDIFLHPEDNAALIEQCVAVFTTMAKERQRDTSPGS